MAHVLARTGFPSLGGSTANFRTKQVGFGGFDPNQLLLGMGWISPTSNNYSFRQSAPESSCRKTGLPEMRS
eukprot:3854475-Heterocapsa_arctica.AAC.1